MKGYVNPIMFWWGVMASLGDISHLKDGEIQVLYAENPVALKDISKWDRKFRNREPVQGDLGIDNKRQLHHMKRDGWHIVPLDKTPKDYGKNT